MRKFKTVKDYRHLKTGDKVYDGFGSGLSYRPDGTRIRSRVWIRWDQPYVFRAGTVPNIRKWKASTSWCSIQRHYGQIREHYTSRTARLRIANWEVDYTPVRVEHTLIDPWDHERHRPCPRSWKAYRSTRYRIPAINRHVHAPAYWE